jgi:hypothetical protein
MNTPITPEGRRRLREALLELPVNRLSDRGVTGTGALSASHTKHVRTRALLVWRRCTGDRAVAFSSILLATCAALRGRSVDAVGAGA